MAMTREHTSRKLKRTASHLSDKKGTRGQGMWRLVCQIFVSPKS
jgi:hypothetical protein